MTEPVECQMWIAVDEHGAWCVVTDEADALGELATVSTGTLARVVKLVVKMTPPKAQEIIVQVPDTAGETATVEVV